MSQDRLITKANKHQNASTSKQAAASKPNSTKFNDSCLNGKTIVLHWGSDAPKHLLPQPDCVHSMELHNSTPALHNIFRIRSMQLATFALRVTDISSNDIYVNIDETTSRITMIAIDQKPYAGKIILDVTNATDTILVVNSRDFAGRGAAVPVGNFRVATLQPGMSIHAEMEVVLGDWRHGAQYRPGCRVAARMLDYCNVPIITESGMVGDRWVSVRELHDMLDAQGQRLLTRPPVTDDGTICDNPADGILLVKGSEHQIHAKLVHKVYVQEFPQAQDSCNTRGSHFYLRVRLGPHWQPQGFFGKVAASIIADLQELRELFLAQDMRCKLIMNKIHGDNYGIITCPQHHTSIAGLLVDYIVGSGVAVSWSWYDSLHDGGFKIKIKHNQCGDIFVDAIASAIGRVQGLHVD